MHGMRSSAKDVMKHDGDIYEEVSTLWLAARRGYADVARLLVEGGADMNKADKDGKTPLYVASQWGHRDVARVLVEAGRHQQG